MSTAERESLLEKRILVMRIIMGSLVTGPLIFLFVAIILREMGQMANAPELPLLTLTAIPFAIIQLTASFLMPRLMAANARRQFTQGTHAPVQEMGGSSTDTEKLCGAYQTGMIVGAALLEGMTLFLLIAYLIEGVPWALFAAIVFLALLAIRFPSRSGVERWVEAQRELIEQEKASM